MRKLRIRVGLLLSAGALMIVIVGPVQAHAKIVVGKASAAMIEEQGPTQSLTAKCPTGTRVLSGGWDSRGAAVGIVESVRATNTSWRITAVRYTNDISPLTLKAFAYCDKVPAPVAETVPITTTVDPATAVGHVVCPDGKTAISAGFAATNFQLGVSGAVVTGAIRSARDTITVTALQDSDTPAPVEATAYCRKTANPKQRKVQVNLVQGERTVRTRACRRSARAGGFSTTSNGDELVIIDRFQRAGARWVAHSINIENPVQTLKLAAYCP